MSLVGFHHPNVYLGGGSVYHICKHVCRGYVYAEKHVP